MSRSEEEPCGRPGSGAEKPPGDGLLWGQRQAIAGPTGRAAVRGARGGPDPQVLASWAGRPGTRATPGSCEGEASPATPPGPMGAVPWAGVPGRGKRGLSVKTAEFIAYEEPGRGQHMGWR